MANNKSYRFVVQLAISLGILAAFVYYLYTNSDKYLELLNISKTGVFVIFVLSLTFPLLNSMQNTYLYRDLGLKEFSHWDGYLITAASTLANQLPIPGGVVSRGYYLKRNHNLSYTKYTSSTIALFFCYISINGLIGVAVLLYRSLVYGSPTPPILLYAFVAMAICITMFWLPLDQIRIPRNLRRWTEQAVDGWTAISRSPVLLFRLIFLQIALVILLSFRYWVAFHMLSQNVTVEQTLLFAGASILTQLVSIAPGGLGVREAIVASVATVLGFDAGISVVAIGLDRLVMTIVIILTGWISTIILGKQFSDIHPKTA